jgi:hypothetical protein
VDDQGTADEPVALLWRDAVARDHDVIVLAAANGDAHFTSPA